MQRYTTMQAFLPSRLKPRANSRAQILQHSSIITMLGFELVGPISDPSAALTIGAPVIAILQRGVQIVDP